MNEFPELGMPQITGTLRDAGITCAQHDLNVALLYDYLLDDTWIRRMEKVASGDRRSSRDGLAPGFALPLKTADEVHAQRLWTERCVSMLKLAQRGYRVPEVRDAVLAGHPVYDQFFQERFFDRVVRPERVLGLSLMSSEQLVPGLILAKMARTHWPDCFVVVGGPWAGAASHVLAPLLQEIPWIDAVVPGRGEQAIVGLVQALRSGADLGSVPNLVCRNANPSQPGVVEPAIPLARAATPSFDGLDLDAYPVKMLPVQTTSRCYWGRCVFCYHDDQRIPLTHREATRVVDDLAVLQQRYGVEGYFFADCATPVDRMVAIAEEIRRRELTVGWSALVRADEGYTPEVCRKLKDGGCRVLLFGLESSSPSELARLRKGISPEVVASTVKATGGAGIATYLFILDYPGHGAEAFEQTLQFVVSMAPWVDDFIVSRFQLSELSRVEEAKKVFGIRRTIARDAWLDVFNVPFEAPAILPRATYEALVDKYVRAFFAARGDRPRRDPFLVGAWG
jgi:anaerobic magnesium-protoporphyrin IX monomethyl ester cyclase